MNHIKTLEDIENLIKNKIQESQNLEYKSELGDKKKNQEIAKDISAFANTSDGGIIIYGVKEKKGLPDSINWIESEKIKERIENIILSSIQPRIKDVKINPISKPDDSTKAIFIVHIPESLEAPHMVNHCYYTRHNFQSMPMEDHEVKNAMFNKGLRKALDFEISQNLELINKNLGLAEYYLSSSKKQESILFFTPFYTEVWKAIVNSGLFSILKEEESTILFKVYSLIYEINNIIDCQKYNVEKIIAPKYLCNKLPELRSLLSLLKKINGKEKI